LFFFKSILSRAASARTSARSMTNYPWRLASSILSIILGRN